MESVTCPGCRKAIRIPEDVLGQTAKCPFCKCHFKAPVRTPKGITEPILLRRNMFARNRTLFPATLMLMVGILGFFNNGLVVLQSQFDPEVFERNTREFFEQLAQRADSDEVKEKYRGWTPIALRWGPVVRAGFALLGLVSIAAAVAMVRRRAYTLALFGSFVTMINLAALPSCCFVVSILVGGYSIFVLLNPEVRASFQHRGTRSP